MQKILQKKSQPIPTPKLKQIQKQPCTNHN